MVFIKNTKWLVASAAALGLGLAAIPFVSNSVRGSAVTTTTASAGESDKVKAATEAGICTAKPKTAPLDFVVKDMNGAEVKLSSYKGKIILLNFWATWCEPCKYEIPDLISLQEQYADDVVVLGFSVDDTPEQLKAYAAEYKVNYPLLVGSGHENIQDAYGPMWGIPVTIIIAPDGTIARKQSGIRTREQFEREIKALL